MNKGQITIRDLALKLNVSISTVSRALRGSNEINPETKIAVLELAKKLHYEPNLIAQSLRNSKTNIIGIIVPEIANSFFSAAISGIQEVTSFEGYNVMICQSNEKYLTEIENVKTLISCRVDGILLSISHETENVDHIRVLQSKNIPLVLFDRVHESLDVSKVVVDDYQGAYKAVCHLIQSGYTRIAHLAGPKTLLISRDRLQGYLDALKNHNLPVEDNYIVHCNTLKEVAAEETLNLLNLSNPPDAIFTFDDSMAIKALFTLKKNGYKIPGEIGLVGFTNDPISALIEPGLTTVSQPAAEMGRIAADMLIKHIRNKKSGNNNVEIKVLKTDLLIRQSSERSIQLMETLY
jgi:DNA-binding LacI/PurR family transcriptional regulator